MSKQYGLILPGQQKKSTKGGMAREFTKPPIFDESSSESDAKDTPLMQIRKAPLGPSLMERRKAKNLQEKALAEDPSIFQYDELYDEMEHKREEEKKDKSKEPKKARYITKLMEAAERRKLENELRVERQVQKEREAEGEEFKDKEAFVTSAYRKKLEELRKLEDQNKRYDYLEAIGDVTKQKDLDGFYRHIYEQKTGSSKDVKNPHLLPDVINTCDTDKHWGMYKPIKSGKVHTQRAYRKRNASDDEDEIYKDKKEHLTNNIDADSDFSIDDSSTESDNDVVHKKGAQINNDPKQDYAIKSTNSKLSGTPDDIAAFNLEDLKPAEEAEYKSDNINKKDKKLFVSIFESEAEVLPTPKPKRDKTEIWRKRTVGDVYVAAVHRYSERKAARNQA